MKNVAIVLFLVLLHVSAFANEEYYQLNSGMGWKQTIKPENLANYIPWEKAIDVILEDPSSIEAVSQGHSLQVNIVLKTSLCYRQ